MAFNPHDIFPGALPQRQVDLQTLCEALDSSEDIPVVYAFGGAAPTAVKLNGREVLESKFTGALTDKKGVPGCTGRAFVEFEPYSWATDIGV